MATAKSQVTESQDNGSLMDFNFDSDNTFFGVPGSGDDDTSTVIKEVKHSGSTINDDDEEPGGSTNLEDDPSRKPTKTIKTEPEGTPKTPVKKSKAGKQDDLDETGEEKEEEKEPVFFGIGDEKEKGKEKPKTKAPKTEETEEEVVEEGKEKGKEKAKDSKEKVKDDETTEEDDENDDEFFSTLATELKEKGIFQNVEIKEGEKITEEKFFELQEQELEARIDETFEAFFEELDEDGKAFLKFKRNGGKTTEFLTHYADNFGLDELDDTNPAHVNRTLTHYLTTYENLDGEDLEDRIKYIKESGKEKAYASKWFATIKKDEKDAADTLQKAQDKAAENRENAAKEFNSTIKAVLKKTDKVGAFPISKAEQSELGDYFTKPVVKIGKNKYVPQFQVELSNILRAGNEEALKHLILLGKLVKDKFDIGDLATNVETKITKETKSKLKQAKQTPKPSSSGQNSKRSMADYFDEEG